MSFIVGSLIWGCSPDFEGCASSHTCSGGPNRDAGVSETGTLSGNGGAVGTGGKGVAGTAGTAGAAGNPVTGSAGASGATGMAGAAGSSNGSGGDAGSTERDASADAGVPDAALTEPDASLDASTPDSADGAPAPLPCDATHFDCDGNANNGCETDISLNVANCGGCNIACKTTGTTALSCVAGICKPTCAAGRLDCDGDGKNGCEVDSQNDATNCGACKYACSAKNAAAACSKGACAPTCTKGFGDCSHPARPAADDGCEADLGKPVSCGACGHDCVDGDCGSDGRCLEVTIADQVPYPVAVTVNATYVHWTQTEPNATTGAVMRTLVKGGGLTTVASGQLNPWSIADDGAYVYWCNRTSSAPSIRRQLIGTSGSGTLLQSDVGILSLPSPLTVDGTNIYWADYGFRQIYKEPKDGSGPPVVLTPPFNSAAFDLEVDGPNVYWDGPVLAPISGAAATVKPTEVPSGHGSFFAIDASYIYYVAFVANNNTYARTLKTLAGPVQALLPVTSVTRALAVDATYLYIAADSGIIRLPKAGGTATTLVPSPGVVTSMVVAGNAVYWIDSGSAQSANGRVMKLPL